MSSPGETTILLDAVRSGNVAAFDRLISLVAYELNRMAQSYIRREHRDHTLQPTALVNEAYLRLINQRDRNWQNRCHFFAIAAELMRHILVDHGRSRLAKKGSVAKTISSCFAISLKLSKARK